MEYQVILINFFYGAESQFVYTMLIDYFILWYERGWFSYEGVAIPVRNVWWGIGRDFLRDCIAIYLYIVCPPKLNGSTKKWYILISTLKFVIVW
jgi:hypothetical protein